MKIFSASLVLVIAYIVAGFFVPVLSAVSLPVMAVLFLIGGLDGRLDHALSNLAILEDLWHAHIRAILSDGKNRVRYVEATSELVLNLGYRYLSILAVDKKVKGVTVDGCKYPLKNATLTRVHQFAVSNEIQKNCALISVRRGGIYILESMG